MEKRSSCNGRENKNPKCEKKKKLENKVNNEKDDKSSKNGRNCRNVKNVKNVKNNTRNINVNGGKTQQCIARGIKSNAVKKLEVVNGEGSGEDTNLKKTSGSLNRLQSANNSKNNSSNILTNCEKISKNSSKTERGAGIKKEMEKKNESKTEITPTNRKRVYRSRKEVPTGRGSSSKNVNVSNRAKRCKKNPIFKNVSRNPSNAIKVGDLKNEENKNLKNVGKTCLQKNQNNFKNKRRANANQVQSKGNLEDLQEANNDSQIKNNLRKGLNKTHIQKKNTKKTISQGELPVIKKLLSESKDGNNKSINNNSNRKCNNNSNSKCNSSGNTNMNNNNEFNRGESMKNRNEKNYDHDNNNNNNNKEGETTQLCEQNREQLLKNNTYNNPNGIDDSHLFNVGGYISDRRPEFDSDVEIVEIEILGKKIKRKKKSDKETEVENWILKNYFGQDFYGNKNEEMDPFFLELFNINPIKWKKKRGRNKMHELLIVKNKVESDDEETETVEEEDGKEKVNKKKKKMGEKKKNQ